MAVFLILAHFLIFLQRLSSNFCIFKIQILYYFHKSLQIIYLWKSYEKYSSYMQFVVICLLYYRNYGRFSNISPFFNIFATSEVKFLKLQNTKILNCAEKLTNYIFLETL